MQKHQGFTQSFFAQLQVSWLVSIVRHSYAEMHEKERIFLSARGRGREKGKERRQG